MDKVVLLVEDNPSDEKLTLRAMRKSGIECEVVVARDGVEALAMLFGTGAADEPAPALPTLVLLDLKLPLLDGIEVLRRIRAAERTRRLPVLVLTSSPLEEDKAATRALGANAYLLKPVEPSAFAEVARTIRVWLDSTDEPTDGEGG